MGAFESFLQKMMMNIGGGEEPKGKKVYTSQEQINKDNAYLREMLLRKGAPQFLAKNSVVARNVGDQIPQYEYANGKPSNVGKPVLQTTLPSGVSINDVFQDNSGRYGYFHPQQGTWVQVDQDAIYQKYKK